MQNQGREMGFSRWGGLVGAAAVAAVGAAYSEPAIYWASSPARAGESVVITGEGLEDTDSVRFVADDGKSIAVKPHTVTKDCVMAEIPTGADVGDMLCSTESGGIFSNQLPVNAPEVWWWLGDKGGSATPGGSLRLFGKSLGNRIEAKLFASGREVSLARNPAGLDDAAWPVAEKDCLAEKIWDSLFIVPADATEGEWPLSVRLPGREWHDAGKVVVKKPAPWPDKTVEFTPVNGKSNDECLTNALAALRASGGGAVVFPRGRFEFKAGIGMPERTVLRGAGMAMTTLYWETCKSTNILETPLVKGGSFGVEDLALCVGPNHGMVMSENSDGFFLRRVRIRASATYRAGGPGQTFRGYTTPARELGLPVKLVGGINFEVKDCDIYSTGDAQWGAVYCGRSSAGRITGTSLEPYNGIALEAANRIIFEGNTANCLYLPTWKQPRSTNIWCSRNRIGVHFWQDMELMTTDCAATAYTGSVVSASGRTLVLDDQKMFTREHGGGDGHSDTNWSGSLVNILSGKGAGQWRLVSECSSGCVWQVDRPWITPPDSSSRLIICSMLGRHLFVDNLFEDGGAVQLFGAGTDSVFVGNRMLRTTGISIFGGIWFSGYYFPTWYCQMFDNTILEGNGWGSEKSCFDVHIDGEACPDSVQLCKGMIFRRNRIANNGCFSFGSGKGKAYTSDSLVEGCEVDNSDIGIQIDNRCRNIVLRNNRFRDVKEEVRR